MERISNFLVYLLVFIFWVVGWDANQKILQCFFSLVTFYMTYWLHSMDIKSNIQLPIVMILIIASAENKTNMSRYIQTPQIWVGSKAVYWLGGSFWTNWYGLWGKSLKIFSTWKCILLKIKKNNFMKYDYAVLKSDPLPCLFYILGKN